MQVWGAASNASGDYREAWLDVPESYQFTAMSSLRSVQRLLAGSVPHGYQTPSTAFGVDYVTGLPGCSFKWV